MRFVLAAVGALLLLVAFGLIVTVMMSMGGADVMLLGLVLAAALVACGLTLIRRSSKARAKHT